MPQQVIRDVNRNCGLARVSVLVCLALSFTTMACAQQQTSASPNTAADASEPKPVPVLSGGVGFVPFFSEGDTTLVNIVSPVLLLPIGQKWLIESRAAFEDDLDKPRGASGFSGPLNKELEYAQIDYIANRYMTITAGRFLTPFGIFNERLYPVWIRDLQQDPLLLPLEQDSNDGFMLRGGVAVTPKVTVNYATYFSAASTIGKLESKREVGSRFGFFFPGPRVEVGGSWQQLLARGTPNRFGFHGEYQPRALPLDIRSEYANTEDGHGMWIEPALKLSQLRFWQPVTNRTQIVGRFQQFWLKQPGNNSLPAVDTHAGEFGLNYYIRDGWRVVSSYGRQFRSGGDVDVWTVGMTFRFVFPLWPGGAK